LKNLGKIIFGIFFRFFSEKIFFTNIPQKKIPKNFYHKFSTRNIFFMTYKVQPQKRYHIKFREISPKKRIQQNFEIEGEMFFSFLLLISKKYGNEKIF